jgi:hypothetical protein
VGIATTAHATRRSGERPHRGHRPACAPRPRRAIRGRARPGRRPLFFTSTTRHVESHWLAREIARGAVALAGITAWAGVLLLLGG